MKNNVLNFLLSLNDIPVIRKSYFFYYHLGIKLVTLVLKRHSAVESLYLKGSFNKENFLPVISDLDFFLVGNANNETRKDIERLFKRINFFFPIVSDFDFHTPNSFHLLRSFGGLKYIDVHEWRVLFGSKIKFSYKFNPRKFNVDICHEIYFQFEWLFKNIKLRNKRCEFSTRKIHRQYQKVQDLLDYANSYNQTKFYIPKRKIEFNKRWIKYSNEKILKLFNDLIEFNLFIKNNKKHYFNEFEGMDFEPILQEKFFQEKVEVLKESFSISEQKEIYLTLDNLKLFYYIGSIDSFLLFDWVAKYDHSLSAKYIELLYYTRLIERRSNIRHDEHFYSNSYNKIKKTMRFIDSYIRFEAFSPTDFSSENVHITVSANKEDLCFYTVDYQVPNDFIQFHVHFGDDDIDAISSDIYLLHINKHISEKLIDHRITLLNFAIDWVFGADNILVGRVDKGSSLVLSPSDNKVAQIIKEGQNSSLWVANSLLWNSILPILKFDSFENIDDILTFQFSGKKPHSEYLNSVIKFRKLKNLLYELEKTVPSSSSLRFGDRVISSFQGYSLVSPLLEEDEAGFVKIGATYSSSWEKLKILFKSSNKDPYFKLELLESYIKLLGSLGKRFDPASICLFDSVDWRVEGPATVIDYDEKFIRLRTMNSESKVDCRLSLVNHKNTSEEFQFYWFSMENELTVETSSLSLENGNIKLSWSGEELYQMQLFLFTPGINNLDILPLDLALKGSETYNLKLKKHEVYKNFEDEDFEFYKTLDSQVLKEFNPIGKVYSGFYKIVLTFNKQLSGRFYLRSKNSSARYQTFSVTNSKDCILYFYENLQATELVIYSEIDVENPITCSIAILKYKRELLQ